MAMDVVKTSKYHLLLLMCPEAHGDTMVQYPSLVSVNYTNVACHCYTPITLEVNRPQWCTRKWRSLSLWNSLKALKWGITCYTCSIIVKYLQCGFIAVIIMKVTFFSCAPLRLIDLRLMSSVLPSVLTWINQNWVDIKDPVHMYVRTIHSFLFTSTCRSEAVMLSRCCQTCTKHVVAQRTTVACVFVIKSICLSDPWGM